MAEFRDLSSGKGPGLPGSYPDSIVRIFILFGGENENVANFSSSISLVLISSKFTYKGLYVILLSL